MNHVELRQLRLRLGWSLSEMARRLGCHQTLILKWESNHSKPDGEVMRQYMGIQAFVDEQSERMRQMPIAETILRDEHLSQVSQDDVVQWEILAASPQEDDSEDA